MNDSILATPINKSISILELISSGGTGGSNYHEFTRITINCGSFYSF